MKPSSGFNLSSVAGAGLQGLPGVAIAVAFVLIFIAFLLPNEWRDGDTGDMLFVLFLLIEVGACLAFVGAERRDRRLSERIEQELHLLSEGGHRAVHPNRRNAREQPRGVLMRKPARIWWQSITASGVSLDGLVALSVVLLFVFGMVGIFVSPNDLWLVFLVWALVEAAVVIGFVQAERRSARQLARVAKELQAENGDPVEEPDVEPALIVPSKPIRPR